MEVFRLAVTEYSDLKGIGGLFGSGRWHKEGNLVVYAASSRSLSVLEKFIHEEDIDVPDLSMISIYIPDDMPYEQYTLHDLPENWDSIHSANLDGTQSMGTKFLIAAAYAYLKVPSAIVPHEYNYIINPAHPDVHRIKIIDKHDYRYDGRYQRFIKA